MFKCDIKVGYAYSGLLYYINYATVKNTILGKQKNYIIKTIFGY